MKSSTASDLKPVNDNNTGEATAAQVIDYLQRNPGFLNEYQELLDCIDLPHANTGNAVSLIERQVLRLREQNNALRDELQQLVAIAHDNDELFAKTRRLILSIITAQNLEQLTERVEQALLRDFNADASALTLFTPPVDHSSGNDAGGPNSNVVPLPEARHAIQGILQSSGAICGSFRPQELAFLFHEKAQRINSAAAAPLGEDAVIGILAVGSRDPDHYHSTMGTVFLNYVTEVLNIILPRLLDPIDH